MELYRMRALHRFLMNQQFFFKFVFKLYFSSYVLKCFVTKTRVNGISTSNIRSSRNGFGYPGRRGCLSLVSITVESSIQ